MLWLVAVACAQVGVVFGETPGVDPATRGTLEAALHEAVIEVSGHPVGAPDGPHLSVSALGAATRLRVQLSKVVPNAADVSVETLDLPRATPGHWRALLVPVIARLFPREEPEPALPTFSPPPPAPPPLSLETTPSPPSPSVWPWVGVGATGLLLAGGIVLGVLNRDLVARGESSRDPVEVDRLEGQVFASGLSANLLLGTAVITGVITTIAFVAGDDP